MAENGVANVIEMRRDSVVEKHRVLYLAGIADNAVVADDHLLADVGVMTNLAVAANNGWPLYHRAVLDDCSFANEYILTDKGHAFTTIPQGRFQIRVQVSLDCFQRIPRVFASVKDCCVLALAEIKQICRFEHGGRLGQSWGK